MTRRTLPALLVALLAAAPALAQSDRETVERTVAQSAQVCPGHSAERTQPGVKAIPVAALRVLLANDVRVCPDRRLDPGAPVVWYGQFKVLAWNPEVEGAVKTLAAQADAMTRKEEFPVETRVWDAQGKPLQQQTVPGFEPRPRGLR